MRLALRVLVALAALLLAPGCTPINLSLLRVPRAGRPVGCAAHGTTGAEGGLFRRLTPGYLSGDSARAACSCPARAGFFRTTAGTAG